MKCVLLLLVAVATASALPQNWPYRDNHEYYGYQGRPGNYYRASNLGGGSGEDDEIETSVVKGTRQDLKVGTGAVEGGVVGQSPAPVASTNAASSPVVVVETGSAKPVAQSASIDTNNKQGTQPKATDASKQPAFPPATPPGTAQPAPPTDEDSEEDSDEEEEADGNNNADEDDAEQDDDDEDDDEDDSDHRRRNDPVVTETVVNGTVANATVVRRNKVKENNSPVQTVEALVPGYVTEQGEVLVPFDTVVKDGDGGVVAVVEDPSYAKNSPPVVVLPSEDSNDVERPVPKFFNPHAEKQLYYSEVPPPGAIFTFDDDNEVEGGGAFAARQGETSSEEALDDTSADTSSAQDDDNSQSEEETAASARPPLSFIKATAPSGEDDEAESLGIRIARMSPDYDPRYNAFYASRSPNYFHNGDGYYVTRYPVGNRLRRPSYYYQPSYDSGSFGYRQQQYYPGYQGNQYGNQYTRQEPIYYYRPASNEKVKVVPIGSFDVSLEQEDSGEVKAVVSPFHYGRRPSPPQPQPIQRRRPTQPTGPRNPAVTTGNRIIIRRGDNKPSLLAVYNIEGGTPVTRQRNGSKQRREAKEMKKLKKQKKVVKDPLGLMGNKKTVSLEGGKKVKQQGVKN